MKTQFSKRLNPPRSEMRSWAKQPLNLKAGATVTREDKKKQLPSKSCF